MTTQKAYEQMREYFSRPDAILAKSDDGTCLYRTGNGDKCAFGCLIPDELYDPLSEEESVDTLLCSGDVATRHDNGDITFNVAHLVEYFKGVNIDFLRRAQSLHDSHAKDAPDFVRLLDNLARDEVRLTVPSP